MSKKYIVSILGHSCVGKSTTVKELLAHFPGTYHVGYDKQKWQLAGYNRDTDRKIIKQITFGLLETVCKLGLPIQLEYFRTEEDYNAVKEIALKYGYTLYIFELQAPYEVLLERFRARVESAQKMQSKTISVTTEEAFNENYKQGYFIPNGTPIFDTTKQNSVEIVEEIRKVLMLA